MKNNLRLLQVLQQYMLMIIIMQMIIPISLYNSVLDNLSDNDGVSKVLTKELKGGDIAYISEDMSYMEGVMLIMECMDSRRVMVQRL